MRFMLFGTIMALAALPAVAGVPSGSAATASPVSTQPLAANEVLLELSAMGTATSRAAEATMSSMITGRGATEAEARRAYDGQVRRVTAAARRAGVAAADLEIDAPIRDNYAATADTMEDATVDTDMATTAETDEDVSEAMDAAVEAAAEAVEAAQDEVVLTSSVAIRLRNVDRVEAVREALTQAGAENLSEPSYVAADQTAARRTARSQALATARSDADAYAAAMGLRVVRIVRVSERVGMDLSSMMMMGADPSLAALFERQGLQAQGPEIPTFVLVGVDFALAPQ